MTIVRAPRSRCALAALAAGCGSPGGDSEDTASKADKDAAKKVSEAGRRRRRAT